MTDFTLDPVIEGILCYMASLDLQPLNELAPEQARAGMKAMVPEVEPTALHSVESRDIPVSTGVVPVRVYRPADESNLPVLVFYHGGGWVVCDLDTHDEVCRQMSKRAHCVVVSVDYRLAPEHVFPAAVDDAYQALCWVAQSAQELGVDVDRLAVAGDSAGGNLAAVVCAIARDNKGPAICYQSLWYPVTNVHSMDTASYQQFAQGYRLEKTGMEWFVDHYLSDSSLASHPNVSPLLASDLSGLPKSYVMTAGFDVLRDEGKQYAQALSHAGNDVEYECFESMIHGFMNMGEVAPAAQQALESVAKRLRHVFW